MANWSTYYQTHSARQPHAQVVRAVGLCTSKDAALDLGAGTLIESIYLLDNGFKKVTAVDKSEKTRIFAEGIDPERFTLEVCSFQEFNFQENQYNLVNALYSLPFNGPENFEQLVENIKVSLKLGGIFVGQFFGVRDDLNTEDANIVFQTREEASDLLEGLELIEFEEVENDASTAEGTTKHWHVFRFMGRK